MPSYFSYKLVTPEKIYLEGNAEIITVPGVEGDIGFLAQHTNFITSIRPGIIKVTKDDSATIKFYVDGGFVKFSDNEMLVVAEEVADESEINSENEGSKSFHRDSNTYKVFEVFFAVTEITNKNGPFYFYKPNERKGFENQIKDYRSNQFRYNLSNR